jgi:lipopolysaccharide biosynthesis regulator YciM
MTDHDQDAAIGALSRRHSDAKRRRAALLGELSAVKAALEEVVRSLEIVTAGAGALTSETAPRMRPTYPDPARVADLLRDLSASCHELEHTQRLLRDAGVDVA